MSRYEKRYHLKMQKFNIEKRFIKSEYTIDEITQIMRVLDNQKIPPYGSKSYDAYLLDDVRDWCNKNNIPIKNRKIQAKDIIDSNLPEMKVTRWLELYLFLDGHRVFYRLSENIPYYLLSVEYVIRMPIQELITMRKLGLKQAQWFLCRMAKVANEHPSYLEYEKYKQLYKEAI